MSVYEQTRIVFCKTFEITKVSRSMILATSFSDFPVGTGRKHPENCRITGKFALEFYTLINFINYLLFKQLMAIISHKYPLDSTY